MVHVNVTENPTARSIQSAIDALEDLMNRLPSGGIVPAHITRITVNTYRLAASKAQQVVINSFGAILSTLKAERCAGSVTLLSGTDRISGQ